MTRYPRIILHAGLHKTGTTSIQENCARHAARLLEHGVVYPVFHFRERRIVNHSDPLAGAFSSLPLAYGMVRRLGVEENPAEAREAFSSQLEDVLTQPHGTTLLLSAEMVADFNHEDMQALRDRLARACDELQVLAYIRSPESSLASILQQRALAGSAEDPHALVGLVRQRFERLRKGFGDRLQPQDFHRAVTQPGGLVAHLLLRVGMPAETVASLEFSRANPRMPLEAYRLMLGINSAFPVHSGSDHGVARSYHDLRPLYDLPGQPFELARLGDKELVAAVRREGQWLERELGWQFPASDERPAGPLWQTPTLLQLEAAVNRLPHRAMRLHTAGLLREEAVAAAADDPGVASILEFIAQRIEGQGECPRELALERLGADYFKFAALQLERASPELAYCLMSLAAELRPDAPFIAERLQHYRENLGKD